MNIKLLYKIAMATLLLPATMLFSSCDEEYLVFDTGNPGIYFTTDSSTYSFSVTPIEIKRYTLNVPVRIMAATSNEPRSIDYVVVPEHTTAEEGVHYEFGEAVILPDSINGYIPVTFKRENLEGNHKEGYERYKLCLQLVNNNHFAPTLDSLSQVHRIRFDNAVDQPNWFKEGTDEKVWPKDFGSWHPYTFIKIVEYFHALEETLPETYANIVRDFGENLESIAHGDYKLYSVIFKKHILKPLYEYINIDENRETILEEYNDYPFDLPDPYADDDDPLN